MNFVVLSLVIEVLASLRESAAYRRRLTRLQWLWAAQDALVGVIYIVSFLLLTVPLVIRFHLVPLSSWGWKHVAAMLSMITLAWTLNNLWFMEVARRRKYRPGYHWYCLALGASNFTSFVLVDLLVEQHFAADTRLWFALTLVYFSLQRAMESVAVRFCRSIMRVFQ